MIIESKLKPVFNHKSAIYLDGKRVEYEEFTGKFELDIEDVARKKAEARKNFEEPTQLRLLVPGGMILGLEVIQ